MLIDPERRGCNAWCACANQHLQESRVVVGSRKRQSGSFHDLLRPDGKTFARPGQRHVAVVPAYLFVKPAGFQIQISNGAYVRGVRRRCRAGGRSANWKMQLRGGAWVRPETSEHFGRSKRTTTTPFPLQVSVEGCFAFRTLRRLVLSTRWLDSLDSDARTHLGFSPPDITPG